jgi:hypothetical protein
MIEIRKWLWKSGQKSICPLFHSHYDDGDGWAFSPTGSVFRLTKTILSSFLPTRHYPLNGKHTSGYDW